MSAAVENEDELRDISIYADANKIAQVIRNLVSNGLKFTPHGGRVEVILSVEENGKDAMDVTCKLLVISVKDTGAGISQVGDDATPS